MNFRRTSHILRITFLGILSLLLLNDCAQAKRDDGTPEPASIERIHALTLEGLQYLYNFELERANEKFAAASSIDPLHPRPLVSMSLAPLWRHISTRSAVDYEEVVLRTTNAIEAGERFLERYERDPKDTDARRARADALTCIGIAYGNRAFAHALAKSYLKSAWDGKKCYDYFRDAAAMDPKFYDAYLGLGLLHFGVSYIPKPLQWIVSILGIEADRERGVKEIVLAGKKGKFTTVEAKYYLAQFLPWVKGDFEGSTQLMEELVQEYPRNTVFLYARGFLKLRQNRVDSALPYFMRMKANADPYFWVVDAFADLRIGDCYFRRGEYRKAYEAFTGFLAVRTPFQFEALGSYYAGIALELLGDRVAALALYDRASRAEAKHGDDIYAARHAAQLVKSPLSAIDSLIMLGRSAYRRSDFEEASRFYTVVLQNSGANGDRKGEAAYGLGECAFDRQQYDDAAVQFREALKLNVKSERWVLPWSHFMLGQIAVKAGDFAAARKEFNRVLDYDDYDGRNWLSFRAEQELERLKHRSP